MSTLYYYHKIKSRVLSRYGTPLRNQYKAPGILAGEIGDFKFDAKIVLYFADSALMHLGDQLFHQPLINLLGNRYEICVALPNDAFYPFYEAQGVKQIKSDDYRSISGAIIISKEDLGNAVSSLFPGGNLFLGFNYQAFADEERITSLLTRHFFTLLERWEIEHPQLPDINSNVFDPFVPADLLAKDDGLVFKELSADTGSKWYVFNDFVNSGYVEANRRRSMLQDVARERKSAGYKIVYVGTNDDRKTQPVPHDFIDLDLRGSFGPIGLYKLFSLENVIGTISFDTFVMHVASAFRKELYIVARRSSGFEKLRKTYVPMYASAENTVKLYL